MSSDDAVRLILPSQVARWLVRIAAAELYALLCDNAVADYEVLDERMVNVTALARITDTAEHAREIVRELRADALSVHGIPLDWKVDDRDPLERLLELCQYLLDHRPGTAHPKTRKPRGKS